MTFRCLDSIYPRNLPAGADSYLGYVDGQWPDFLAECKRFPGAHIISLAVFAGDDAEGCDCERLDLTISQVPGWTARQLKRGVWRPVNYASIARMPSIISGLHAGGIKRTQVRLLSAHYGAGKHICGPTTCRYFERLGAGTTPQCDGTQWTNRAPGLNGTTVDESLLADDFFGGTMSANGPEHWDDKDVARVVHIMLRDVLAHAGHDYTQGMSASEASDVHAAHDGLLAVAKAPFAKGGS